MLQVKTHPEALQMIGGPSLTLDVQRAAVLEGFLRVESLVLRLGPGPELGWEWWWWWWGGGVTGPLTIFQKA